MNKNIIFSLFVSVLAAPVESTSVLDIAQENGIVTCEKSLKNIAEFIIDGESHSTHASWHEQYSDDRLYTSLSSKGNTEGSSHVTVITAPTGSGKCDSSYIETYVVHLSCLEAREKMFDKWQYKGVMNDSTLLLETPSGAVNLYLSPQGNDLCLVSKREVIYH